MPNSRTVKSGESLGAIAKQNNVTVAEILAANPEITNPNQIRVGQVIQIPSAQSGGSAAPTPNETHATTAAASGSSAGGKLANAILDEFESSGASAKTAKQDKLPGGVGSSEKMADFDRKRVMAHKAKFILAANQFSLPPALLAAIASRESRGGAVLKNGFGDGGHGFGLMQVDNRNKFKVQQDGGPAGQPHINQATGILADKLATVKKQFSGLSAVEQLQMAVSRYNGGAGKQPPNSDAGTTGGDYMNDVWARARFYARVEDWS
ncbi:MAG TPA: LysM peptidoglycan-binding domain-containing protein [Pyrinomonadaceae bacterium]|jgi:LysM repeat protein|nr:LysM peptidoglycan-binding domain-containing protein [Pyrinomonadaceae bacterium]